MTDDGWIQSHNFLIRNKYETKTKQKGFRNLSHNIYETSTAALHNVTDGQWPDDR